MAGRADAPNIVGAPLDDSIVEQFNQRSLKVSQIGLRTNSNLQAIDLNNCWVRLSSFVNIFPEGATQLSKNVNNQVPIGAGVKLAEEWALKSEIKNGNVSKFGVEPLTGAYGTGGASELGYRPMPGIYSISVEAQPPAGAIKNATIKIKAWNLNQLSILDMLYFRLGFSMLLEWGHNTFTDNKGNLQRNPMPIDIYSKTGQALTKEDIMVKLASKRLDYAHNYDGMLGLVTNYEWTQNVDGSYDCTVKLTGIGSLAESIKINTQTAVPELIIAPGTTTNQTAIQNDSSLSVFLTALSNAYAKDLTDVNYWNKLYSPGLDLLAKKPQSFQYGYNTKYMSLPTGASLSGIPLTNIEIYRQFLKLGLSQYNGTKQAGSSYSRYIPLGALLAFLNNSCTLYDHSNNENKPALYVDCNTESNFCFRIPQQFSADPGVCLVSTDCTASEYEELFTIRGVKTSSITTPLTLPQAGKRGATLSTSDVKYHDSSNPNRGKLMHIWVNVQCILDTMQEVTDNSKNVYLNRFLVELMAKIQQALGNINVFKVGYDDTANTLYIYDQQLIDWEGKQKPIPELPVFGLSSIVREFSLRTEISTRLGSALAITARAGAINTGVNQDIASFSLLNTYLEDRLLKNVTATPQNGPTAAEIEAYNLEQGAANPYVNVNPATGQVFATSTPASTTALSPTSIPGVAPQQTATAQQTTTVQQTTPTQTATGLEQLANVFNQQIQNIYNTGVSYNVGDVEQMKNFYIDSILQVKGKNYSSTNIDSITATGVLPLALNITLSGIGGIPLYEAFTIPVNRLPAQYIKNGRQRIGFTVMGLNHTIENNQWLTTIRAMMIPLPDDQKIAKVVRPTAGKRTATPGQLAPGCKYSPCTRVQSQAYKSTALYKNPAFRAKVDTLTVKYKITDSEAIYKVMYAESKLDPKASLVKNGVRKTAGLIQFTNATVKDKIVPSLEEVYNAGWEQQMVWVEKYFDSFGQKVQGADLFKLYTLVFFPLAAKHATDPNWVVQSKELSAEKISASNPAIACAAGKSPGTPLTIADFRTYVNCIS